MLRPGAEFGYLSSSKLPRISASATLAVALCCPGIAWAGKKKIPPPPPLPVAHAHPSGAFSFRTPDGWTVTPSTSNPDILEVKGGELMVRFLYRPSEGGLDTTHVDCMLERLAGPMAASPQVKYEYDFRGGVLGNRGALDSAFVVTYDTAIDGHHDWRQRNLTLVGRGETICIITYAPAAVWKKSLETQSLLDAVVGSVTFNK
jgi:hypothetical protein